jgi:hypothetical protein
MNNMSARETWIEKLNFLETELAKASDSGQKFSLLKSIEEAKRKIAELGGEPEVKQQGQDTSSAGWNWQSLDGEHLQQLHGAIMASFDKDGLEQMTRFHFNQRFDAIVGSKGPLSSAVFDLLEWAESRGKLRELFEAAVKQNPTSPALLAIRAKNP